MLPPGYHIRPMEPRDFGSISAICARVYPTEAPYTAAELAEHHRLYPQGQFVAEHVPTSEVAGVHFTLRLRFLDFHHDDPWDVLTDHGTFDDHDPVNGFTLYGADLMIAPEHQHHGLAHALTDVARGLARAERLWRMVGASRLPGYAARQAAMSPDDYVAAVVAGALIDPVLTIHLHDGWAVVRPIQGYLPHDDESAGWAALIQWVNPEGVMPPGSALGRSLPAVEPTPA